MSKLLKEKNPRVFLHFAHGVILLRYLDSSIYVQKFNALNHSVIVMAIFLLYYRFGFKWLYFLFEVKFLPHSEHRATK